MRFILLLLALAKISSSEIASVISEPLGEGRIVAFYPEELRGAWWYTGKREPRDQSHLPDIVVTARTVGYVNRALEDDGSKTPGYGQVTGDMIKPPIPDVIRVLRDSDGTLISCAVTRYKGHAVPIIRSITTYTYIPPDMVRVSAKHADGTNVGGVNGIYRIK